MIPELGLINVHSIGPLRARWFLSDVIPTRALLLDQTVEGIRDRRIATGASMLIDQCGVPPRPDGRAGSGDNGRHDGHG